MASVKIFAENRIVKRVFDKIEINFTGSLLIRQFSLEIDTKLEDKERPISQSVINSFSGYFPTFVKRVLDDHAFATASTLDRDRLKKLLEYNVPYGYRRTPYITLAAYHTIEKPENMTEKKLDLLNLIAWCIHTTQWSYQILDDIVDETDTRDNKPCWYKRQDIALNAINDGFLVNSIIPNLLRRYFSDQKYYLDMLELFSHVNLVTTFGQCLDCMNYPWPMVTVDRWKSIVYNKTVWHQSIFPFKTAMYLTNTYNLETFKRIEPLLHDFGMLFQMTNDFYDGFPVENLPGVNSTDIQEGKTSWLLVHALELCNPRQRSIIEENYGKRDQLSIAKVMEVYRELGLKEYGEESKDKLFCDIIKRIDELPEDFPKKALTNCLIIGHQGY